MGRSCKLILLVFSLVMVWGRASDERLIGSWRTTTYTIAGVDHPMDGIMIFTPTYFSANVILNFTGGEQDDGNGNAGPYWAEDGKILFVQWMQLHFRPGDPKETFLKSGIDEPSTYRFEDPNKLILRFPSGNFYTLDRLPDSRFTSGLDGLWAYKTLQSRGGEPVPLDGLFLLHQGYFLQQSINRGRPSEQLGQGHIGVFREGDEGIELTAETGVIVDPSASTPFQSRNNSEHKIKAVRQGETLQFTFGSGTVQVFERIPMAGPTDIYWLQGGALGLIDKHFILVVDSGNRQLSGSGTFTRNRDQLTLQGDRWFEVENGKPKYRSGSRIRASIEKDGVVVEGRKISLRQ